MEKGTKISLFLISVFLIMACTDSRKVEIIRQAEQLMSEQPDSALHLLQTIDRHTLRGKTLARYALIYSIAQDKSGLDVSSDSLLRIANEYYSRHPEDSLYARSQYYMGLYYSLVDSTKQAEDCLRTAIRYAEERKDYYTQYLALDRLSSIVRFADAALALEYSKQALKVFERTCPMNPSNKIYILKDIGKIYILCNIEDSALYYMDIALKNASMFNDSSMIGEIMQEKSLVYTKAKDYQKALSLAKKAWELSPSKSINLVSCLAGCFADADSAAQSKELYAAIIKVANHEHKYIAYKHLSVLAAKEQNEPLSMLYSDSAYECMEAIYSQQLRTKAAYYNDIILLEEKKIQQEREISSKRLINLLLVMLFVVAATISFFIYNNIRYKAKQKLKAERERHLLQVQFEHEQHERELKYKDDQISMMRILIMKRCAFRKKIEEQKKSGKHITLSLEDWEEITTFLNTMNDNFLTRLTDAYPNLREKDYQFCMLVRLGFPNKDLANIYGIAEVSIKQKMITYKERFKIPSEGQSFKQFISNF